MIWHYPATSVNRSEVNIHEVTEHVIDLFKFDLKNKDVIFRKDYDPSIPEINTNKEQLIQALINLVRNSIQALEHKGNVSIRTRTESSYTIGNSKYSLVAKIDVIDNGPGIPEDKLKEIFYPMVSTKTEGMVGTNYSTIYYYAKSGSYRVLKQTKGDSIHYRPTN